MKSELPAIVPLLVVTALFAHLLYSKPVRRRR
jgi:hypothetical protein